MKISLYETNDGEAGFHFFCPGCKEVHGVRTKSITGSAWNWNGSIDKPTVSPSVLVTFPNHANYSKDYKCHSFIKDGKIQFLNDSGHELSGQTVEIPEFPY